MIISAQSRVTRKKLAHKEKETRWHRAISFPGAAATHPSCLAIWCSTRAIPEYLLQPFRTARRTMVESIASLARGGQTRRAGLGFLQRCCFARRDISNFAFRSRYCRCAAQDNPRDHSHSDSAITRLLGKLAAFENVELVSNDVRRNVIEAMLTAAVRVACRRRLDMSAKRKSRRNGRPRFLNRLTSSSTRMTRKKFAPS